MLPMHLDADALSHFTTHAIATDQKVSFNFQSLLSFYCHRFFGLLVSRIRLIENYIIAKKFAIQFVLAIVTGCCISEIAPVSVVKVSDS